MKKSVALTLIICLLTALSANPAHRAAGAAKCEIAGAPLSFLPRAGKIGAVEATGALLINGRRMSGQQTVWAEELLQTPAGSSARVALDEIGELRLDGGAAVKLSTGVSGTAVSTPGRILFASLLAGSVETQLEPSSRAVLHVADSLFVSSEGAAFRAAPSGIEVKSGEVRELGRWAIKFALPSAIAGNDGEIAAMPDNWPLLLPALPAAPDKIGDGRSKLNLAGLRLLPALRDRAAPSFAELNATSAAGEIGRIEAFGEFLINGRATRDRQLVWNGETIQASPDAGARATLDGIGRVALARDAIVRLTVIELGSNSPAPRRALVAELIRGNVLVQLDPAAQAVLHSRASAFAAAPGSAFRARAHDGQATVEAESGQTLDLGNWAVPVAPVNFAVQTPQSPQGQTSPRYSIRPVNLGYITSVRARGTRQIQVQVTDENDQPVPDLPVLFLLGRAGGGSSLQGGAGEGLTLSANTNNQGIASANFTAGDAQGTVNLKVTVPGTTASWDGLIVVTQAPPGFWAPRNSVPVLATVGAIVGTGITIVVTKDRGPAQTPGPPVVRP